MRDYQTKANQGPLPDSITAEKLGAGEANSTLTESKTAVSSSGQTLAPADGTGEATDQLSKALAIYGAGGAEYCLDTGAADAYVLAPVSPKKAIPAYFDGMTLSFKPGNINTGASTVNYASLGVKSIKDADGNILLPGALSGTILLRFNFSTDQFEQIYYNPQIVSASFIDGLVMSNGSDSDHDIDISVGKAALFDGSIGALSSSITKQIDVAWAAGSNSGGLFSGSVAVDTWYGVFIIKKDSDSSIDAGFDVSPVAANIPSGYTAYRRIGWVLTDSGANILDFTTNELVGGQIRYVYDTPISDVSGGPSLPATRTLLTVSAPIETIAQMSIEIGLNGAGFGVFQETSTNNIAPSVSNFTAITATGATSMSVSKEILLDSNSQIAIRSSTGSMTYNIVTNGFTDRRVS